MAFDFTPQKTVEVPELEFTKKVVLPASKTALVIVDMQNDFVKPEGNLVVPAAKDTISNIQNLLDSARKMGVQVAYTQDTHFAGDLEWNIWPEHCRKGTWGWNIIDELKPDEHALICEKNRYDGFYGTELEHYLAHVWHVENLVITGTVSNICVLHTAGSAALRWFKIVVPANGISALTEFAQAATLHQITSLYNGDVVMEGDQIHFELEEGEI